MRDHIEALKIHVDTLDHHIRSFKEDTEEMEGCEFDKCLAELVHAMACTQHAMAEAFHAHMAWHLKQNPTTYT